MKPHDSQIHCRAVSVAMAAHIRRYMRAAGFAGAAHFGLEIASRIS